MSGTVTPFDELKIRLRLLVMDQPVRRELDYHASLQVCPLRRGMRLAVFASINGSHYDSAIVFPKLDAIT